MESVVNPELDRILEEVCLYFHWDAVTRTWQLERRSGDASAWRSVMYVAPNKAEAERSAISFIKTYYLEPTQVVGYHSPSWVLANR